ncbi:MAG: hypothetical protein KTR13_03880 [Saprospiraceae bacterium]|nr:hypothetical protein [Saprospiraceae bacterium]
MLKLAIIEDDKVEQAYYRRLFKNTSVRLQLFSHFDDFFANSEAFDFLLSDYYVGLDDVTDYVDRFKVPFVIVSNHSQSSLEDAVLFLSKPLSLDALNGVLGEQALPTIESELASRLQLDDYCETEEELQEMLVILDEQLKKAKATVSMNVPVVEQYYTYHNLANYSKYFGYPKEQDLFEVLALQTQNGQALTEIQSRAVDAAIDLYLLTIEKRIK